MELPVVKLQNQPLQDYRQQCHTLQLFQYQYFQHKFLHFYQVAEISRLMIRYFLKGQ